MTWRLGIAGIAAVAAMPVGSAVAYATSCAEPASEELELIIQSVTIDGVDQPDLSAYDGWTTTIRPWVGSQVDLRAEQVGPQTSFFYEEVYDVAPASR
jgi:hypothetical protein